MKTKISYFAAAALLTAVTATSAHAGFVGRTLQATYFFPDLATSYTFATATPAAFTVGTAATVETTVDVEGVTQIAVDFTDTSLRFDFTTSLSNPTWTSDPFNGIVFDRLAGSALSLASASIDPSSTFGGFTDSRVSWSDNQLTIDWNGLSYVNGTSLLINFTSAPASVPEPGSLALLGMALVALACITRQKLNAKAEQA
ncbi:MAG: PEP-CTERM sorting domain-containing protein [Propionivibrio sp.]